MKLSHPLLEQPLLFGENEINVLIIENQRLFTSIIQEIFEQIKGNESNIVLSSNGNILDMSKNAELIVDYYNLEFNQKKVLNKLYQSLTSLITESEEYLKFIELSSEMVHFIENIVINALYPVRYVNELEPTAYLKFMDVRLEQEYGTMADKIVDYILIMQEYARIQCFILVNIKSYLSEEEIESFYQFICYNKYNVLLIENQTREKRFDQEVITVIDEDLCQI